MSDGNIKDRIKRALAAISAEDFLSVAKDLLEVLGYQSRRTQKLSGSVDDFICEFPAENENTRTKRIFHEHTQSVRLVFQVTSDEIASADQPTLGFEAASFDKGRQRSFIFFAVELKEATYPRGQYAQFTREINKRLSQPTVVLFKNTANLLTLAFVHRREHKRDPEREVLGNVSLIREIDPSDPHRAHLDILAELSLEERLGYMNSHNKPTNFDGLLASWLDALDTEALNKRFYRELFAWFERAVTEAKFPKNGAKILPPEEHTIRLITRLLFVWFIKEKGLIADELFIEEQISPLLKNYDRYSGDSYYRAVLQNLFFATLNTEIDRRDFSKESNATHRNFSLYRYRSEIRDPDALLAWFAQTPFINGGLFDCLDSEEATRDVGYRIDCFSDNPNHRRSYSIPNHLFFDNSPSNPGLITLFERYKFTVEENTPIEQEVALDPELLGKVFENLLAAYNPETRETARKQTGSYYTPRVVVDYMVEEALVATLVQKAQPDDGDAEDWQKRLRKLLDYAYEFNDAKVRFTQTERNSIIRTISKVKVLDPAVGSGAFPMGMLHKLTLALRRLDPNNKHWKALQKELAKRRAADAFDTSNQEERDTELKEISDTFEKYRDSDFGRKLYLIQNSIFGVDIQPVACQIAKLRFFISLAIEQDADEKADNFGIKPLPNLETRFISANTLLSLKGQRVLLSDYARKLEREVQSSRERHFHATTRKQKLACRRTDQKLRKRLSKELSQTSLSTGDADRIAHWDPYDQNATADFFDPEWMFGVKDGFDVVIGNPPYIQLQKNSGELGKLYKGAGYVTFARTGDIYCLFYEKGIDLLKANGHLCHITSNKWMRAGYGKKLRRFFVEKTNVKNLLDFGGFQVFEHATVDTNILLIEKAPPRQQLQATHFKSDFKAGDGIGRYARENAVHLPRLGEDTWFIGSKAEISLKEKIERLGKPLKEWDIAINYGVKTGYNTAFIIDNETKKALIAADPNSADIIKPVLRGRDINRYQAEWAKLWLIATFPSLHLDIDKYPAVRDCLKTFLPKLYQTGARINNDEKRSLTQRMISLGFNPKEQDLKKCRKATQHAWFEVQDTCAYHAEFEKAKIIWGNLSVEPRFAVDIDNSFISAPTNLLTGKNHIKYIAGVLNSQYCYWRMRQQAYSREQGYMEYKKMFVERIPIPKGRRQNRPLIIQVENLVDQILASKTKNQNKDTTELENRINKLVYRLYELTIDEINIIEST